VTISEVQLKESKLLSPGTRLGIQGQIDKLLSLASNDNVLIEETYEGKPESIDTVMVELDRLRKLEGHTFAITKVAKESGEYTLLIKIVPISEASINK
jgi:hypothetical protein